MQFCRSSIKQKVKRNLFPYLVDLPAVGSSQVIPWNWTWTVGWDPVVSDGPTRTHRLHRPPFSAKTG